MQRRDSPGDFRFEAATYSLSRDDRIALRNTRNSLRCELVNRGSGLSNSDCKH